MSFPDRPSRPEGPLDISDVHKEGCKLKWKPPKDDGGLPIDGYVVEKMDVTTGGRSRETLVLPENLRRVKFCVIIECGFEPIYIPLPCRPMGAVRARGRRHHERRGDRPGARQEVRVPRPRPQRGGRLRPPGRRPRHHRQGSLRWVAGAGGVGTAPRNIIIFCNELGQNQ